LADFAGGEGTMSDETNAVRTSVHSFLSLACGVLAVLLAISAYWGAWTMDRGDMLGVSRSSDRKAMYTASLVLSFVTLLPLAGTLLFGLAGRVVIAGSNGRLRGVAFYRLGIFAAAVSAIWALAGSESPRGRAYAFLREKADDSISDRAAAEARFYSYLVARLRGDEEAILQSFHSQPGRSALEFVLRVRPLKRYRIEEIIDPASVEVLDFRKAKEAHPSLRSFHRGENLVVIASLRAPSGFTISEIADLLVGGLPLDDGRIAFLLEGSRGDSRMNAVGRFGVRRFGSPKLECPSSGCRSKDSQYCFEHRLDKKRILNGCLPCRLTRGEPGACPECGWPLVRYVDE